MRKSIKEPIKTVAPEALVAEAILLFCENLAELGCPKNKEPVMWFRYLDTKEQLSVADHLISIIERNAKI